MYVIGLDVGTSGAKAIVTDEKGKVWGQGYQGYEIFSADGGVVEQKAESWWEAGAHAIREACANLDKKKVRAISLSTQGASSVLVDKNFTAIGSAITWMDKRAAKETEELHSFGGKDYFYKKSGWELGSNLDAAKLLWIRRNRPDDLSRAHKFISTIEYMNYCLTEKYVIDPTNAAIRQLMDIETNRWDKELLGYIGVGEALLPEIEHTGASLGKLCSSAAEQLGLSALVEVYNGAHDQYCCAIGSGSINSGDLLLGTGTAWVVMSITEKPLFTDSKISPARHVISGLWGALSSINCGGSSLDWWKNQVADLSYEEIDRAAAAKLGSNEGLMFYPYFIGTGCPSWQESARGTFTGLELRHTKEDMALAVTEGIVFHTVLLLEEYEKNGANLKSLRVMGGAAKSKPWMEILKASTDCQVLKVNQTDAAAMGAAIIASVGSGIHADYAKAVENMVSYEVMDKASPELYELYHKKYRRYKAQWKHLSQMYKAGEECDL